MPRACLLNVFAGNPKDKLPDEIMKGKAQTLGNKVAALVEARCTKRFLEGFKLRINHPVLNSYQSISIRHRFTKGFSKEAIDKLIGVWNRMGKMSIAHHRFPLTVGILMDPVILTSQAFERQVEKNNVPAWRDGKCGADLQV